VSLPCPAPHPFVLPIPLSCPVLYPQASLMAYDSLLRRAYFIFFGILVIFAVIELSISAWLTARYDSHHNYLSITERDRVRFLLFCSTWTTLLSPIFPVLLLFESAELLTGIAAHVIFLFLSWVFWLSGAAAITESLGGGLDCHLGFVYCSQLNALEAFAWIEWVVLTVGFIYVLVVAVRVIQRGEGYNAPLVF